MQIIKQLYFTNQKNMKKFKFLLSLLMMALCVGFASCGEDNDNNPNNNGGDDGNGVDNGGGTVTASIIVGTWNAVWISGYAYYDGIKKTFDEAYTYDGFIFNSDGTGFYIDEEEYESMRWNTYNGKLLISVGDETEVATIKSVSGNTLILVDQGEDEDGPYYYETTYKKR